MNTRLALLRHGHTAWNREHRLQGQTDIPLDDEARDLLRNYRVPPPWDEAKLWSSPLSRAVETAQIVADRDPQISAALMETHWGVWEGTQGKVLRSDRSSGFKDIEDWGWGFRPPGGEAPADLKDRLLPWLAELKGNNLAVCHIGTMRVLLALAYGWDFCGPCPFAIKRNRLYILEQAENGWRALEVPVRLVERLA